MRGFLLVTSSLFALACSPARLCVPGASVPCTGPGGCTGGQVCQADGNSYGACVCGGTDAGPMPDVPMTPDAGSDAPLICNPITQTGCAAGERCAWDSTALSSRCAPDGTAGIGDPCTLTSGIDDCASGGVCIGETCATVCQLAAPTGCAATEGCVAYAGLFEESGVPFGGACVPSCDPVSQLRPDGTSCGAGQGCYMLLSPDTAIFVCAGAGMLTVGQEIVGPVFANSCAPGLFGLQDAAGTPRCTPLCRPVTTSVSAPAGAGGAAPLSCADVGAPGSECLFAWQLSSMDPPDSRLDEVGYCFDRTGRMFDDDGDGTPEIPWPSCTTRLATDGPDPDMEPENHETGCAPY